jgi:3',5'-cyclic AMP phosphodiesterase CpdA
MSYEARPQRTTRRHLLRLSAAACAGGVLPLGCRSGEPEAAVSRPPPDFTVAFLTDPHVFADKGAPDGFARSVRHALEQRPAPELIITGGDLAFDVLRTDVEAADAQYDLFERGLDGVRIPVHHTLGNHDLLGVYPESPLEPDHPRWGKAYFLERFGLERSYYSFDWEGWHFVVLDTLDTVEVEGENGAPREEYRGYVDAEQLAWLADDLAVAARPTIVIGHIPLFSNYWEWQRGTAEKIPDRLSVVNAHEVAKVLVEHPVRLVLAGHLHVIETFRYKGIELANLGAVSGNWWNGLRDGFQEGYSVLELRGDQVEWRYVDYGWEPPAEEA